MIFLLLFLLNAQAAPRLNVDEVFSGGFVNQNFVVNPSASKSLTLGITATITGAFTRNTITPLNGIADFAINAGATGETVRWSLNTISTGLKGGNCEARATFTGDATLYKFQILSGTTVLSEVTMTNETTSRDVSINYPCGDLSDTRYVRIISTGDGAAINVGSVYYGKATNIGISTPPAATATISGAGAISTQNFTWISSVTHGSTGNYTLNFVSGIYQTAPSCTASVVSADYYVRFGAVSTSSVALIVQNVSASAAADGTFNIICTNPISQTAVRIDQSDFGWTSFTPTGSWSTNTTYTGKWRRNGENAEYIVDITTSGAPTSANLTVNLPSGHVIDTTKLLVGTPAWATPLGEITVTDSTTAGSGGLVVYENTTSVRPQYFRKRDESTTVFVEYVNVSETAPYTMGSGDRVNMKFSVPIVGWTANQSAPLLVGSVTSSSTGMERIERVSVIGNCTSTPCTITSQSGAFSSVSRSAQGSYTLNITSGLFSSAPTCSCNVRQGGVNEAWASGPVGTPTTTAWSFTTVTAAGTLVDTQLNCICIGPR